MSLIIPNEIYPHIFSYLNLSTIIKFSRTCRVCHILTTDFMKRRWNQIENPLFANLSDEKIGEILINRLKKAHELGLFHFSKEDEKTVTLFVKSFNRELRKGYWKYDLHSILSDQEYFPQLRIFVGAGFNIFEKDVIHDMTVVHQAAKRCNLIALELLTNKKMSANQVSQVYRMSPLHFTINSQKDEQTIMDTVIYLIKKGALADFNALFLAIQNRLMRVAEFLVNYVPIDSKNETGHTVLQELILSKYPLTIDQIHWFAEKNANLGRGLYTALDLYDLNSIIMLIQCGAKTEILNHHRIKEIADYNKKLHCSL